MHRSTDYDLLCQIDSLPEMCTEMMKIFKFRHVDDLKFLGSQPNLVRLLALVLTQDCVDDIDQYFYSDLAIISADSLLFESPRVIWDLLFTDELFSNSFSLFLNDNFEQIFDLALENSISLKNFGFQLCDTQFCAAASRELENLVKRKNLDKIQGANQLLFGWLSKVKADADTVVRLLKCVSMVSFGFDPDQRVDNGVDAF